MPAAEFSFRSIAVSAYGPALLFGLGQGAVFPVIALSARELGASVGTAALVVALVGLGQVVGDLPAGALAARFGDRRAMIGAAAVTALALLGCVLAPTVLLLGCAVAVTGLTGAVFGLARQSYLTESVPLRLRARALSSLGGVQRVGFFVGPFVGAVVTARFGVDGAYAVFVLAAGAAALLIVCVPDVPNLVHGPAGPSGRVGPRPTVASVARAHARLLRTLGVAALLVMAVRQARQSVLPLWGEQIGLDVPTISVVMGVSGAVDMLLFYPAGSVMDRWGRAWVGVPSMLVLGLAHALLPLAGSLTGLLAVAVLMGVGNGMGAGLVMTLGADASPDVGRQAFLGAWRLMADTGFAGGPLLVGAVAAAVSLGPASWAVTGLAVLAAAGLARWVPRHETLQRDG